MTARKVPLTLKSAIALACKPLGGVGAAALAIGQERYRVAHASNPNKPDMLRVDDAIALDQLCLDAGGGAPIMAYYRAALAPEDGPRATYHAHLAAMIRDCAAVNSHLAEYLSDNKLSRKERLDLLGDAEAQRVTLGRLISDLKQGMDVDD